MKAQISLSVLVATLLSSSTALAQGGELGCGSLRNAYGPFDYRTATPDQKGIVENAHFTPGVESLTRGKTGPFGGDIRYTLIVFPNHPRALMAMERLVEKERANPARDAWYSIECFYERALRFRPDDHVVRLLYVNFLVKRKETDNALKQLDYVADTTRDNPFAQFNVGMLYMDMKLYDKALEQAHRVIAMGFDRRELRERLTAAGHWVEPPASAASAPEGAASAPASGASS
jgi:hypothetical protein